jgi:transposase
LPRKRLTMRKIREVLRLKAAGLKIREIAESTGSARTTVYEYLVRAEGAGLSWPLPEDLDDEALEARLFPPATAELARRRPVPDWREVHRELRSGKHVTLRLLWLEWKAEHSDGWGYSQFCAHYERWRDCQDIVMRLSYPAGDRMFVDFSGDKVPVTDPGTGEVAQAEVFVAVLGCSGMLYVEATGDQRLESWLMAHVHAFEAYGGAPVATTPDNLRSGVTKACYYDPEINASYAELARHYSTVILPTRTYRPRDKAAVEAGVLVVERWVLAPLRKLQFFSLAELNKAIRQKVAELNGRPFRGEPTSRRELFEELERPALKPLPAQRYELAEWKKVTVNIDYHVEHRDISSRHYYSVPYTLVHQKLELRATASAIEVYKGGRRVASHPREHGRRRYVTDPAHMPPSHRAHLEWTPSRLVSWASTVSPHAAALAEKMLASRPHPEHSYRACLGLMNLAKRYGNERLGAACQRALASGAISYTSVKSILAQNLDRAPLPEASPAPAPAEHENLRGAGYYADDAEKEA